MNDQSDTIDTQPDPVPVEPKLPAFKAPLRTGAAVAPIIPRTYEEAWRIATHYVKTGMAPRDMKTPERVMIALMAGMEVGLPPIAALNSIAIINNRPRIWGAAVPALAINSGQLAGWDETVQGDGDDMMARCLVARRVSPDLIIRKEMTFSVADARRAGLWDERTTVERWVKDWNTGKSEKKTIPNDSPWFRYPKRMMQMRTRQAITDLFSDVFCGLGVAEVYVGPNSDSDMRDVTPASPLEFNPLGPASAEKMAADIFNMGTVADEQQSKDARSEAAGDGSVGEATQTAPEAKNEPAATARSPGATYYQEALVFIANATDHDFLLAWWDGQRRPRIEAGMTAKQMQHLCDAYNAKIAQLKGINGGPS